MLTPQLSSKREFSSKKELSGKKNQFVVRAYQPGDEKVIIEQFNQVFNENRSLTHWSWKFNNNPQGGPYISMAWKGDQLACHYAVYPLSLTVDGKNEQTYHVGDSFTMPSFRGVGLGKTNLLSQTVNHFHKTWCENQVDFFFGFLTGVHLKLGKRFLSYVYIASLYEYQLSAENIALTAYTKFNRVLKGYRIELVEKSGAWADELFERAKKDYSILITRNKTYLNWRYDNHPDFNYQYVLLKKWGTVVGWCVLHQVEKKLLLIDAFCQQRHSMQMAAALQEVLANAADCTEMIGWFADTPDWWSKNLVKSGFIRKREYRDLDLCVTFFSSRFTAADLAGKFYFAMGDSDMF